MDAVSNSVIQIASPIPPWVIYGVIALLIVIENGLIFGFFFPSTTLLLAAGVLAGSYWNVHLYLLVATVVAASFIGSQVGYSIGSKFGYTLERNENSKSIQIAIQRSQKYFIQNRFMAVFIANFIPGMRVFISPIAGLNKMKRAKFIFANLLGTLTWATLVSGIAFKFAEIELVHQYPLIVLAALFLIASGASIVNFYRSL